MKAFNPENPSQIISRYAGVDGRKNDCQDCWQAFNLLYDQFPLSQYTSNMEEYMQNVRSDITKIS